MDRYPPLDELLRRAPAVHSTIPSLLAYAIAALFFLHQALVYLDFAVLSPFEIAWNAIVYFTPAAMILDMEQREVLQNADSTWSQTHAAKSEGLRAMMPLRGSAIMQQLPAGANIVRSLTATKSKPQSDAPPGLGNWDNSCYQNSVLQGLSAMDSLKPYLAAFSTHNALPTDSTSSSLQEIVQKLNSPSNNGSHIWTPAKLKSMSSWQQQDAQEYYSKIVDDLEKEASKVFGAAAVKPGLENAEKKEQDLDKQLAAPPFSVPLEGLLAQRVACTRCGFSEGLSMIPFNCLTVPLGSNYEYDLAECLDEYTHIEDIAEVECAKCTLLRTKTELNRLLGNTATEAKDAASEGKKVLQLPPALRENVEQRLRAATKALDSDDFSDKTLKEACQISKKARASSTKTRQAVIGRAPRSLVIHVNRSVFDEMTGDQKKNYAAVRYPQILDLGKWMLGSRKNASHSDAPDSAAQNAIADASESMLSDRSERDQCLFRLKAVITHYGRHENGHYIAYRQHPPASRASDESNESEEPEDEQPIEYGKLPWWRLSDEDVSSVPDEDVLQQGGVFMLFYEREDLETSVPASEPSVAAVASAEEKRSAVVSSTPDEEEGEPTEINAELDAPKSEQTEASTSTSDNETNPTPAHISETSTGTTTEDESEVDVEDNKPSEAVKPVPKTQTQPRMRTARANSAQSDAGFPSPHRVIAAT
jgi:ubiquitin carboxyl-terminal hydrolase 1